MQNLFRKSKKTKEPVVGQPGFCPNCGNLLSAKDLFCSSCGQKRMEPKDMSFAHLFRESFLDYFHFDSKFFRTIIPLVFKPGFLTSEFMGGRRKRYVEPFRLFLVVTILYFLLMPISGNEKDEPQKEKKTKSLNSQVIKPVNNGDLHFTIQNIRLGPSRRDSIQKEVDSTGLKAYVNRHYGNEPGIIRLLVSRTLKIMLSKGQSFGTVLEHTASKMVFVLIPVLALLLKLLYIRRKKFYFEHLIFSLHIHSFVFLILLLFLLAGFLFKISSWWAMLISLVYFFAAMKRYYRQRTGKTLLKYLVLTFLYFVIGLPVFFILLILVAMFTF